MYRIAGHVFPGQVNFRAGNDAKAIAVTVPLDTSDAVLNELKDARAIEVLNGNSHEVVGIYRLCGWRRIEIVYGGIQLMWATINPDEVDELKEQVEELREENAQLRAESADLTEALLELAEIIGGE